MKLSEAIFIFERYDFQGSETLAPFSSLSKVDQIELAEYFLGSQPEGYTAEQVEKASRILESKLYRYQMDLQRSHDFIEGLKKPFNGIKDPDDKKSVEDKETAGNSVSVSEIGRLTDLVMTLSKIGSFDLSNISVYEANRIQVYEYRRLLRENIKGYLELIKGKDPDLYQEQIEYYETKEPDLQYTDEMENMLDILRDEYEAIGE